MRKQTWKDHWTKMIMFEFHQGYCCKNITPVQIQNKMIDCHKCVLADTAPVLIPRNHGIPSFRSRWLPSFFEVLWWFDHATRSLMFPECRSTDVLGGPKNALLEVCRFFPFTSPVKRNGRRIVSRTRTAKCERCLGVELEEATHEGALGFIITVTEYQLKPEVVFMSWYSRWLVVVVVYSF